MSSRQGDCLREQVVRHVAYGGRGDDVSPRGVAGDIQADAHEAVVGA